MIDGVVRRGYNSGQIRPIGFGYVTIPSDIDRDIFVRDAMRRERITIAMDEGQKPVHECYIIKEALNRIVFPSEAGGVGSPVVYICDDFKSVPVVIGVLEAEDNSEFRDENTFEQIQRFENNLVNVSGNARNSTLFLNVTSSGAAYGYININGNTESLYELFCSGVTNLSSVGNFTITSWSNLILRSMNSDDQNISSDINIGNRDIEVSVNRAFRINEGSSPIALGDRLQDTLNDLTESTQGINNALRTFATTQSAAAIGPLAPLVPGYTALNTSLITQSNNLLSVISDLRTILSEISFTD